MPLIESIKKRHYRGDIKNFRPITLDIIIPIPKFNTKTNYLPQIDFLLTRATRCPYPFYLALACSFL